MRVTQSWLLAATCLATWTGCGAESAARQSSYRGPTTGVARTADGAARPEETAVSPSEGGWIATSDETTSTFSIDVDTGSYTVARRAIVEGRLPTADTVRVEEFINFFPYDYRPPGDGEGPFSVSWSSGPSVLNEGATLLRIALQGRRIEEARERANLVFLVDVSGSMQSSDKLGLVQVALKELVRNLEPTDTVAIVVYAGADSVLLRPTPVSERTTILDAVESFAAGGSTAGEAGIRGAYALAREAFVPGGINRVVLCTDGDFNVGLTGSALIDLIEEKREEGVFLTALGFGTGNYQDGMLEQLADHGNGNYAYIDNRGEAIRVLGENLVSTLAVIAKDVKIQVEFDADAIERYRLVGYENRVLANEDFRDDTVDAGEIGAGHQVTALYEVVVRDGVVGGEPLATLRLRHKEPTASTATEATSSWNDVGADLDGDLQFTADVVDFAEHLRNGTHRSARSLDDIAASAELHAGSAVERVEFVALVRAAADLAAP